MQTTPVETARFKDRTFKKALKEFLAVQKPYWTFKVLPNGHYQLMPEEDVLVEKSKYNISGTQSKT